MDISNRANTCAKLELLEQKSLFNNLVSYIDSEITHISSLKLIDSFAKTGNGIKLINQNRENSVMSYLPEHKVVVVSPNTFDAPKPLLYRYFIHELYHHDTFQKLEKKYPDLYKFYYPYDDKSVQIITQTLEISALYNDAVISFEQGDRCWSSFIKEFPSLANGIEHLANRKNIKIGNKIPKEMLKHIADLTIIGFCIAIEDNNSTSFSTMYKMSLLANIVYDYEIGTGKNSINPKNIFDDLNIKTSFDDKELDELLLFSPDILKKFPISKHLTHRKCDFYQLQQMLINKVSDNTR